MKHISAAVFLALLIAPAAHADDDTIVNSTCSVDQVIATLNTEQPEAAAELFVSPIALGILQQFVAAPPDARRGMLDQMRGIPDAARYVTIIGDVAQHCMNY